MKFTPIPQDLEFWNHALWVFPPTFVRRFCPKWIEIGRVRKTGFSAYEIVPF
ncbi:hypothetical protein L2E81_25105 [Planktothrix agardhii 1033]|jgi:hypothetical protein|nr:hypothetical protein [Planktothrix agardhii 1033]